MVNYLVAPQESLARRVIRTSIAALLTLVVFLAGWGAGFKLGYAKGHLDADREWLEAVVGMMGTEEEEDAVPEMPENTHERRVGTPLPRLDEGVQSTPRVETARSRVGTEAIAEARPGT